MPEIILAGRTGLEDYFKLSGVFSSEKLNHTPLLVFLAHEDSIEVRIIDRPTDLLNFADDTPVMGQWRGEWRSDFFQFTVGQYRQRVEAQLEPLKSARNVVKYVGPHSGFRFLSYEYTNEKGTPVHQSTYSKQEAERLEAFFIRQGIHVEMKQQT